MKSTLMHKMWFLPPTFLICCFCCPIFIAYSEPLIEAISITEQTNMDAKVSQQRIDGLDDEAKRLLEEYRNLIRRSDSLSTYNKQLKRIIDSQNKEKEALVEQFDDLTTIQQEIMPVMQRMIDTLTRFISLDIPFLVNERSNRVKRLQNMMTQSTLSVSERFRYIIDAYKIEVDYGHTVEAYRDELQLGEGARMVEFLKVGRIALYYQTADGKKSGCWDAKNREWMKLPKSQNRSISKALKVARKQVAPALLELTLRTPEVRE